MEAFSLLAGSVLIYVSVQLAKAGVDRDRPVNPLAAARNQAYPSGHAAYSTLWAASAVALARALPGIARDAALIGVGIGLTIVIGLSRVYLRVHWWSDVVGGWALGAGLLSAVGAVALIVALIRHNGGARQAPEGPT